MNFKLVLLLIAAVFATSCFAQVIAPSQDRLYLDFFVEGEKVDSEVNSVTQQTNDMIEGGNRKVFVDIVRGDPLNVDGVAEFQATENFFVFSVPSGAVGRSTLYYNGDTGGSLAYPCGDLATNTIGADCALQGISGTGLNLDVSRFSGFGFVIRALDIGDRTTFTARFWFNNGQSGFVTIGGFDTVNDASAKPLVFFPFASLGTDTDFASGVRAIAVQIDSEREAIDCTIGPLQFTGIVFSKASDISTGTTAQIGDIVTYTVTIDNPEFILPRSDAGVNTEVIGINTTAAFIDTFDAGLDFEGVVSILDANGASPMSLDDTQFTTNPTDRTLRANFVSDVNVTITIVYTATVVGPFASCNVQLCNSASLDITTRSLLAANQPQEIVERVRTDQACIAVQTNPTLTLVANSCPPTTTNFAASQSISYTIGNPSTGVAENVIFTVAKGTADTCQVVSINNNGQSVDTLCAANAVNCQISFGTLAANAIRTATVNYLCTGVDRCLNFLTTPAPIVTNDCGSQVVTNTGCTFGKSPSVNLVVTELAPAGPFREGAKIQSTITVRNTGNSIAESVVLRRTYGANTTPTQLDAAWTCDTTNRICTRNIASVSVNDNQQYTFCVLVDSDFPVAVSSTGGTVSVTTDSNIDTCDSFASANAASAVQVGTPDITLSKTARTSRYTFRIRYNSMGDGSVSGLQFRETLQPGWTLSQISSDAGWVCAGSQCTLTLARVVPAGEIDDVFFIVDVTEASQNNNEMCWTNTATITYNDAPTTNPEDRTASATIGSQCLGCNNNCDLSCPELTVAASTDCPSVYECIFNVPEMWCPPCNRQPPACPCGQCQNNPNVLFATTNAISKKK